MVLQLQVVDVAYLGCPLEVVVWRPYVLILVPSTLHQSPPQVSVPSLHYEHLLVKTYTVFALPSLQVHGIYLLLLHFLLLFLLVVELGFLLGGRRSSIAYIGHLRLISQGSQLFVSDVVKFLPALVASFRFQHFLESLFELIIFHGIAH